MTTWRRLQWQSDSGSRLSCAASTFFRLRAVEKRQAAAQSGLRSKNGIAAAAGAVLVLVAALLAVGFVQGRSDVSDRRATLDRLEAQVAQKQAAASVSAAVFAQAQAHLAAFTAASSGRSNGTACSTSSHA